MTDFGPDHRQLRRLAAIAAELAEEVRADGIERIRAIAAVDEFSQLACDAWPCSTLAEWFTDVLPERAREMRTVARLAALLDEATAKLTEVLATLDTVCEAWVTVPMHHACTAEGETIQHRPNLLAAAVTVIPASTGGYRVRYVCPRCLDEQVTGEIDANTADELVRAGAPVDDVFLDALIELCREPER